MVTAHPHVTPSFGAPAARGGVSLACLSPSWTTHLQDARVDHTGQRDVEAFLSPSGGRAQDASKLLPFACREQNVEVILIPGELLPS